MITLLPVSTAQTISVYSRRGITYVQVVITNEESEAQITDGVQCVYLDGMITFDIEYPFLEGRFYWMRVNDVGVYAYIQRVGSEGGIIESPGCIGSIVAALSLNKSKIYVTAQTDLQIYDIGKEKYNEISKPKPRFYVK